MPRSETGSSKQPADEGANALSFEAAMQELESLVQRMEQGDVPLEDGLKAFVLQLLNAGACRHTCCREANPRQRQRQYQRQRHRR